MRAVVFAGAGASFGTSRTKYPTTFEFFRHSLPAQVKVDPLFQILTNYVLNEKRRAGAGGGGLLGPSEPTVDIEELLFAANEFEAIIGRFVSTSTSVARYVAASSSGAWPAHNPQPFFGYAETLLPHVQQLRRGINAAIHDAYDALPTEVELAATWSPLLNALLDGHAAVDVFTTNYDLVLETAIKLGRFPIDVCSTELGFATLDCGKWTKENWSNNRGNRGILTKLHGSLNWTWGRNRRIDIGGPAYFDDSKQVAIYPGFKGEPNQAPFADFHAYLEYCLSRADLVVFIGFAFRDQYLNSIFARHLSRNNALYALVDPSADSIKLPFDSEKVVHFNCGFADAIPPIAAMLAR